MSGVTALTWNGLSLNNGGRYVGILVQWRPFLFAYLHVFGHRVGLASFPLRAGPGNRTFLGGHVLCG